MKPLSPEEASIRIQSSYRGYMWRKIAKKAAHEELVFIEMKPKVICSCALKLKLLSISPFVHCALRIGEPELTPRIYYRK